MKKFVAVPAIISLVLVLSFNVQATAPIVDDIPDIRIIRGGAGPDAIFDLDDYVTDYDDADSALTWTSDTSGGGFDSAPSITIGTGNVVDIGGSVASDHGTATLQAEDGDTQTGDDDVVITYSDFWLSRPSLSDGLVAYLDTNIEVQPIYVVRDATTTLQSGGSLTSETVDWTVNMRGLLDRVTYPRVTGFSNYGMTVAIAGDGTFTIDPSSTLTEAIEIGFRASKSGTGTAPKDDWSGARVIAVQDMLPRESNSGDVLQEHCFEGTGLTELPEGNDFGLFPDQTDTYGWTAYYAGGVLGIPDYSAFFGTYNQTAAQVTLESISSEGLPEGSVGGPLPWGTCLKMNFPVASGNLIYSARYDYPDEGDTLCFEFWVATDIPASASKERPRFRGGFSTTAPTHELSEFDFLDGWGSPLPLDGEGWKKFQVFYTAQVNTSNTPVDHFRIILFGLRKPKTLMSDVNLYVDNVAVYKVKPPIDVADLRADPSPIMGDDLAYGATALGMGNYPSTDDLDGTFERTTSKASNTDPVMINGLFDLTPLQDPVKFNPLTGSDYTLEISSTYNYTFSESAGSSLKLAISDFNYDAGSKLSVISLTTLDPCNLVDQGVVGNGYFGLTFWMRCDADDYYQATGPGQYGHVPSLRYGVYDGGSFTPVERTGIVYSKQTSASAMPVLADGWKKMRIIIPVNTGAQGLMLAYYMICGSLQGSDDPVYIDDVTFHKVNDPVNYYDDSLFN
jgi:hypothetical protein